MAFERREKKNYRGKNGATLLTQNRKHKRTIEETI
jgi:hypothetical protein